MMMTVLAAGTSGAEYVDYFLSDKVALPPEFSAHFSERYHARVLEAVAKIQLKGLPEVYSSCKTAVFEGQ